MSASSMWCSLILLFKAFLILLLFSLLLQISSIFFWDSIRLLSSSSLSLSISQGFINSSPFILTAFLPNTLWAGENPSTIGILFLQCTAQLSACSLLTSPSSLLIRRVSFRIPTVFSHFPLDQGLLAAELNILHPIFPKNFSIVSFWNSLPQSDKKLWGVPKIQIHLFKRVLIISLGCLVFIHSAWQNQVFQSTITKNLSPPTSPISTVRT